METMGEFLQQTRKEKGLRLEDIAAKTRINLVYLQALEANQFEKFPSEVMARGFARSYARCIGLDETEIMTRFDQQAQSFYKQREVTQHKLRRQMEETKAQETRRRKLSKLSLAFLICLALAVLYWLNTRPLHPPDLPKAEDNSSPSVLVSPPAISTTVTGPVLKPQVHEEEKPFVLDEDQPPINKPVPRRKSALSASGAEATPVQEPSISFQPIPVPSEIPLNPQEEAPIRPEVPEVGPPADEARQPLMLDEVAINKPELRTAPAVLTLTIEAIEAGWVAARIDDTLTKEVFLEPGEKVIWMAAKQFILSLGNAGGVKIELNGKPLGPFGPRGAVVKEILLTQD